MDGIKWFWRTESTDALSCLQTTARVFCRWLWWGHAELHHPEVLTHGLGLTEKFCATISLSLWKLREECQSSTLLQPGKVPGGVKCPLECPITSNAVDGPVTSTAESLELRKSEKGVNNHFKWTWLKLGVWWELPCILMNTSAAGWRNHALSSVFNPCCPLITRGGMIARLPFYTGKGWSCSAPCRGRSCGFWWGTFAFSDDLNR